ncbi:hypothetical protein M885DRAFT_547298 [Pelagophyceae sp. CCMP2097]|nr:hypothetical protein M885DRAFT_547298 [Pelagophyceae sp. CCMP2097]
MSGLKFQLTELTEKQSQMDGDLGSLQGEVKDLWRCDDESKELTRSLVRDALGKMQAEFADVKEEMDHKFNLQVAENKRLQGHVRLRSAPAAAYPSDRPPPLAQIADMKKENKNMYQTTQALQDRVKQLEAEIIGL